MVKKAGTLGRENEKRKILTFFKEENKKFILTHFDLDPF